jgi:hypothetical protein
MCPDKGGAPPTIRLILVEAHLSPYSSLAEHGKADLFTALPF